MSSEESNKKVIAFFPVTRDLFIGIGFGNLHFRSNIGAIIKMYEVDIINDGQDDNFDIKYVPDPDQLKDNKFTEEQFRELADRACQWLIDVSVETAKEILENANRTSNTQEPAD